MVELRALSFNKECQKLMVVCAHLTTIPEQMEHDGQLAAILAVIDVDIDDLLPERTRTWHVHRPERVDDYPAKRQECLPRARSVSLSASS